MMSFVLSLAASAAAGAVFGFSYFLAARASAERALGSGNAGAFAGRLFLRLGLAGAGLALICARISGRPGQAWLFLALAGGIPIGRHYAFKSR
ncbi:MAG: hypothetical protein LBH41_00580 [Rickettsiales bacterium]|jgi:hypothetical protein|nr:hypothetical protein [Rickettsiales bacterium]